MRLEYYLLRFKVDYSKLHIFEVLLIITVLFNSHPLLAASISKQQIIDEILETSCVSD